MYCVVEKCRSIWKPNSSIKFHSFPKDAEKLDIWLSSIKLKGKMYKSAKICSNHFKPEDYDPEKPGHLLDSAVPFFAAQSCDCDTTASLESNIKPKTASKQQEFSITDTMFNKAKEKILMTALTSSKRSWQVPQPGPSHLYTKVKEENEVEPPHKRPCLKDFNMQVKMKSPREVSLEKTNKILQQKITRQQKQINNMQTLISIVRNYTGQSEIENILQGNFKNICNTFNNEPKSKTTKYSDEVKAFALTMNFYSPKAYEHLRTIIELPHPTTLWRSIAC